MHLWGITALKNSHNTHPHLCINTNTQFLKKVRVLKDENSPQSKSLYFPEWSIGRICEGLSLKRLISPENTLEPDSHQALF